MIAELAQKAKLAAGTSKPIADATIEQLAPITEYGVELVIQAVKV